MVKDKITKRKIRLKNRLKSFNIVSTVECKNFRMERRDEKNVGKYVKNSPTMKKVVKNH